MSDLIVYLPAVYAFAAVAFGTIAVIFLWEGIRRARRHSEVMSRLEAAREEGDETVRSLLRSDESGARGALAALAASGPFKDIGLELRRAGMDWSPVSFAMLMAGAAASSGLAAWVVTRNALFALICTVVAGLFPLLYLKQRRKRRILKFEEQFPEAIDLMGRAIRAGHPLSAGIRMVSEETKDPIAGEFRQIFEEQRFGLPFEEALLGLADRNDLGDVRIFVTALLVQREVGGNLAEILDKISQTIRARFTIRRQLRVYTAQGRLSGYVLGAMPIVVGLGLYALNPEYIGMLFTEAIGRFLLIGALTMQIIGYLWIRKIVDIEI
ncbi:MAG: type II secretion system F family protein [Longimicrobiales bacterium]